jgi:heme exporter protein A
MHKLTVQGLAKRFGSRKVFSDVSFELATGESIAIIGPNGSGKSTLVMTLLSHYLPTKGVVNYDEDGRRLEDWEVRQRSSLVSPYLFLYDHLTAEENLTFFATVSGENLTGKEINSLLSRVGLEGRGADLVGEYSSGMKQRLKYAVALLNSPAYLFLDEPTSNLDEQGKNVVREVVDEYRSKAIIVIATNEKEEQGLAGAVCRVGQ